MEIEQIIHYALEGDYSYFNNFISDIRNIPSDPFDYKIVIKEILKLFYHTSKSPDEIKFKIIQLFINQVNISENVWILIREVSLLQILIQEYCMSQNVDIKSKILRCFNMYLLKYFKEKSAFWLCNFKCCENLTNCLCVRECYKVCQMISKTVADNELDDENLCDHIESLIIMFHYYPLKFDTETFGTKAIYSSLKNKLIDQMNSLRCIPLLIVSLILICHSYSFDVKGFYKDNFITLRKLILQLFQTKIPLFSDNTINVICIFLNKWIHVNPNEAEFKEFWKFDDIKRIIGYFIYSEENNLKYHDLAFELLINIKNVDVEWTQYFYDQLNVKSTLLDHVMMSCKSNNDYLAAFGWKLLSKYLKKTKVCCLEEMVETMNQIIPMTTDYMIQHGNTMQPSIVQKIVRVTESVGVIINLPNDEIKELFVEIAVRKNLYASINYYLDAFFNSDHNLLLKLDIDNLESFDELFCETRYWYLRSCRLAVSLIYLLHQFENKTSKDKLDNILKEKKIYNLFSIVFSHSSSYLFNEISLVLICDGIVKNHLDVVQLSHHLHAFISVNQQSYLVNQDENYFPSRINKSNLKEIENKLENMDINNNVSLENKDIVNFLRLENAGLTCENNKYDVLIHQKDEHIMALTDTLNEIRVNAIKNSTVKRALIEKNVRLTDELSQLKCVHTKALDENRLLLTELAEKNEVVESLHENINQFDDDLKTANSQINTYKREIDEYVKRCENSKLEITRLKAELKEKEDFILNYKNTYNMVTKLLANQLPPDK